MVLESILNPKKAEGRPWEVFAVSFILTVVAVAFAVNTFPKQASILSVAFVTIIFVPFFQKLFEIEEEREDRAAKKKTRDNLLSRHKDVILTFAAFFLGIVLAMSFLFIFYPGADNVFELQTETLRGFSGSAVGSGAVGSGDFLGFLSNNTQVMILVFILSLAFGAGAIFILAWNASVIAVYAGLIARSIAEAGAPATTAYLYGVPVALGSIALHGIPEIAAYFVAGLAGGILSVGILREKAFSPEFNKVFVDSLLLFFFAEFLIIIAAYIEAVF